MLGATSLGVSFYERSIIYEKNKLFLLIFLFTSCPIFSQNVYVGFGNGLNFIIGDNYYTTNFGRFGKHQNVNGTETNFDGLGLSNEMQLQLNGKYSIHNLPLSINANVTYFRMRGNESIPIYDVILQGSILQDVTSIMDIWSFQIGANYSFDLSPIKPFLAASLLSNYFDDVYIKIGDSESYSQFRSYKNGMRYGYSIGTGLGYFPIPKIELELSANYNSLNVFHKRNGEASLNSISVLFNIYYKIY